jgi:hypothetical protein
MKDETPTPAPNDTSQKKLPQTNTATNVSIEAVEQRLQVVEKTEARMFEVLKWGFAIFSGAAILFTGFNWWSSRSNYERDKDSLKQQVEILEKQLTLAQQELTVSNDKHLADFKSEADSLFLSSSTNLQNEFAMMQRNNDVKWTNISIGWTTIVTNEVTMMTNLINSLTAAVVKDLAHNRSDVNDALTNAETKINWVTDAIQTNVDRATFKAMGSAIMAQEQFYLGKKTSRSVDLIVAAKSYLEAAHMLYIGRDEMNLRRCITASCVNCIPELLNRTSKAQFANLESQERVQDALAVLIPELEKANIDGTYSNEIDDLKHVSDLIKDKLGK